MFVHKTTERQQEPEMSARIERADAQAVPSDLGFLAICTNEPEA